MYKLERACVKSQFPRFGAPIPLVDGFLHDNGTLRFIQDLQPVNRVTIRNAGIGPTIDEFAKAFTGRSIYSVRDLYSGYDQFQLAVESRDITTI